MSATDTVYTESIQTTTPEVADRLMWPGFSADLKRLRENWEKTHARDPNVVLVPRNSFPVRFDSVQVFGMRVGWHDFPQLDGVPKMLLAAIPTTQKKAEVW